MSPTQRPDTLMQDRPPPARRNPLATHGRTIHPGQSRRSRHVRDMSALPPTAVELVRCSETTRCAMCGRIWTPPDCNGVRHVEDQGPQLLTYIRLPDAAYVDAASLDGFSPASTSMAPNIGRSHAGPHTRFGKRRGDRFHHLCRSLQWLGGTSLASLPRRSGVLRPIQP